MTSQLVRVTDLNVSYGTNHAIQDVSFDLHPGNITAIMGPNGSGKSTLMKALLELIPIQTGRVRFGQATKQDVQRQIAYVPQHQNIDRNFPINVFDTVLLGTYPKLSFFQRPGPAERETVQQVLHKLNIDSLANRHISELSGGQLQRVFLARALAQNAEYFFLDEPFTGIDFTSEQHIIKTLKEIQTFGKTILIVHHDLNTAAQYFDEILLLNQRRIAFGPPSHTLTEHLLAETFHLPYRGNVLKETIYDRQGDQ